VDQIKAGDHKLFSIETWDENLLPKLSCTSFDQNE